MNSAALNASEQGDLDKARAELVAIGDRAREIGDRMMVAFATINLGMVRFGRAETSRPHSNTRSAQSGSSAS